jgi:hypothetical protein
MNRCGGIRDRFEKAGLHERVQFPHAQRDADAQWREDLGEESKARVSAGGVVVDGAEEDGDL